LRSSVRIDAIKRHPGLSEGAALTLIGATQKLGQVRRPISQVYFIDLYGILEIRSVIAAVSLLPSRLILPGQDGQQFVLARLALESAEPVAPTAGLIVALKRAVLLKEL
jgi:hypothetical protein